MKKLFTLFLVLAMLAIVFSSCKKDDSSNSTNSVTITGEFTSGDITYKNPTFDLGAPDDHEGYLVSIGKNGVEYNAIELSKEIVLNDGTNFYYNITIYSAVAGSDIAMNAQIQVYPEEGSKVYVPWLDLSSSTAKAKITKVGEVGEYIEGSYEGDFSIPGKANQTTFHVVGNFKVKRVVPERE